MTVCVLGMCKSVGIGKNDADSYYACNIQIYLGSADDSVYFRNVHN